MAMTGPFMRKSNTKAIGQTNAELNDHGNSKQRAASQGFWKSRHHDA
jgi:hypothetical protein